MRARGYSLVELIVGVALAALVVGGALQMHLSFSRQSQRQQQAAELHQTLRVALQLIERAIRSAGHGLPATHTMRARVGDGCTAVDYYGFQFSNDNVYTDPKTTFSDAAAVDRDPDWFRVIAADDAGDGAATYAGSSGADVQLLAAGAQPWRAGDLFFVIPDVTQPPSACAIACARPYEVTRASSRAAVETADGAASCYNPTPALDGCLAGSGRPNGCAGPGSMVRRFASGGTVYRVASSKLTMRTAPFGTPFDDPAHPWTPLADNIEDLQLAVILADGTTCDAVDDPRVCNFGNAAAVRVTLVGRSPSGAQSTVTATVQLRNYAR